jgi:hypothetical protein
MTTSGSVDYAMTALQIMDEAFDLCSVGSEGESINADMYARAFRSLNLIVKTWGTHEHLWLRTAMSVPLVASQAAYSLSPKPMRVVEARRKVTASGIETPLMEWAQRTYLEQPNKSVASIPTAFYYDPQRDSGTLYVWPTASAATAASMTLELTYLRRIEDFDATGDSPDLPQEWLQALTYALAAELAVKYCATNPALISRIEQRAAALFAQLDSFDTEPASLFLQPETR